jgi:di/tricarboxylate transporter
MRDSGLAGIIVDYTMAPLGHFGPIAALAALYLVTAVLTEVMSNNAAAVLLTPIALGTAETLGVDAKPMLIAVMFAASTAFATPVGYQTNTMVYSAGGYRFSDFMKIGIPLNLLFFVLAVLLIPRYFPFDG